MYLPFYLIFEEFPQQNLLRPKLMYCTQAARLEGACRNGGIVRHILYVSDWSAATTSQFIAMVRSPQCAMNSRLVGYTQPV